MQENLSVKETSDTPPMVPCLPPCGTLPSLSVAPPLQVPTCYSSKQRQRVSGHVIRGCASPSRCTQVDKQSKRQIQTREVKDHQRSAPSYDGSHLLDTSESAWVRSEANIASALRERQSLLVPTLCTGRPTLLL